VTSVKTTRPRKSFDQLRKQIDADPARRARVDAHKAAMLGELRRRLDLTQVALADRLEVTQENVSHIERGEADVRLSTLSRYVAALGGRLELRAAFADETVALDLSRVRASRRSPSHATAARASSSRGSSRAGKAARAASSKRAKKPATSARRRSQAKQVRKGRGSKAAPAA
jgi:transcriptional regulator with XRE-family HTH domain